MVMFNRINTINLVSYVGRDAFFVMPIPSRADRP